MKKDAGFLLSLMALAGGDMPKDFLLHPPYMDKEVRKILKPKPMRKCALPECEIETNHNSGYCSKEHNHLHRERNRRK